MSFADRAVLVTGGTSGLGAAVVAALAAEGAKVMTCGLEAPDHPVPDVTYTDHDVRDDSAMAALVAQAVARFGRLCFAVNSAGISHLAARLSDLAPGDYADVMATNAGGIFHAMRHQIPAMLDHGDGAAIVNIASTLSQTGAAWMAAYGASKHAVIGLTLSAALDYADQGVRINAVSPGPMDTPMFHKALTDIDGDMSKYAGGLPPGGPADPRAVARCVLYLLSDEAAGITGTNLFVDQLQQAGRR